jgi:hypothetical protein
MALRLPGAPDNPYRRMTYSSADFTQDDPWAEDRRKAPGLTTSDVDYLMRQAFAQGRQDAFAEAQKRHAEIYDQGYAVGRTDGRVEVAEDLSAYEPRGRLHTVLGMMERRLDAPKSTIKAEREWLIDIQSRVALAYKELCEKTREHGSAK